MGKSSQKQYQKVTNYYLSVDYGVCMGEIDSYNHIKVKDTLVWAGERTSSGELHLDQEDIFGGIKKEGGVYGVIEMYLGTKLQRMSAHLSHRLGLTSDGAPGYRGIAHLFFRSKYPGEKKATKRGVWEPLRTADFGNTWYRGGFLWTANNPFLPPVSVNVTRLPKGTNDDYNRIEPLRRSNRGYPKLPPGYNKSDFNDNHGGFPDANPAWIIYECMTSTEWGMGTPASSMGASFEESARILHEESFGLSMIWTRQETIENFVQEVLDHIQGILYLDPATGKWELTLIREDYSNVRQVYLSEDTCRVYNRARVNVSETINEIVITWTDPISEGEKTSTFQDLGNIAAVGGIVSENRNYYGIRNAALAAKVGARDIRSAAYPLFSCEIETDDYAAGDEPFVPGMIVYLSYADDGIVDMPLRVFKVDYGRPGSSKIRLSCTEDIFGIGDTEYVEIEETLWEDPVQPPVALEEYSVQQAPYPLLVRSGFDLSDVDDGDYPSAVNVVYANNVSQELTEIEVHGDVVQPNGSTVEEAVTTVLPTPVRALGESWTREAATVTDAITLNAAAGLGADPAPGDFFLLGSVQGTSEIVMIDSYDSGADQFTVARGIFDTTPLAHDNTTPVWYLGRDLRGKLEAQDQAAGSASFYRLYAVTDGGKVDQADAPLVNFTPGDRNYAPFRPADMRIDGTAFDAIVFDTTVAPMPASVEITWATRNRTAEDVVAKKWTDASVTPEGGQTTMLRVVDEIDGTVLLEETGLTGTSYTLPTTELTGNRHHSIRLFSERNGLLSFRYAEQRITVIRSKGYGNQYGFDYG